MFAGMHASISAHIAREYLLDEREGRWGPNLGLFQERLGNPGVRERVENLYFAYLFVLRAALKAGPLLKAAAYDTGSPLEDARTSELVRRLVRVPCLPPKTLTGACKEHIPHLQPPFISCAWCIWCMNAQ